MSVLGIDPGNTGALVLVGKDQTIKAYLDMPTLMVKDRPKIHTSAICDWLETKQDAIEHVVMEQVGAMPKQGLSSTCKFCRGAGILEGIVVSFKFPHNFVLPIVWKSMFHLGRDKDVSRLRACELFPNSSAMFARKKDDGRAESALLALYGLKIMNGGKNG